MLCPYCFNQESRVIDSRESGHSVRRRRACFKCSKRFTTYERVESLDISVIKKDGSRQLFDSSKILNGMALACEKRPLSREKIVQAAMHVEAKIRSSPNNEISSRKIGSLVMAQLKELDEVAYLRFASVCKKFKAAKQFEDEIKLMR